MAHDNLYTTGEYNPRRFFFQCLGRTQVTHSSWCVASVTLLTKDRPCMSKSNIFVFWMNQFKYGLKPWMKKGICLLDGGSVTMQGQETDLLQNPRHFCPSIWSYTHAEIEESSPLFLIAAIVSATQDVLNKTIHCHKT